jgi:hypothetical protein
MFPSPGERWKGRDLLCWVRFVVSPFLTDPTEYMQMRLTFYLRTETHHVSEICSLEYRTMNKVQKLSNPECHTIVITR